MKQNRSFFLLTALVLGSGFGLWWKQQHDALVGAVKSSLKKGQMVTLVGFGSFYVGRRAARTGFIR